MSARRGQRRPIDWAEVHRLRARLASAVEAGGAADAQTRARILKERAVALARPTRAQPFAGDLLEIVVFRLGDECYGIESAYIAEVFAVNEPSRLPCVPRFVVGIVNLRGAIVSVVDLRRLFDMPDHEPGETGRVILLRGAAMTFGVLVDSIVGIRALPGRALQGALPTFADRRQDYLKGIAEGCLVVLDAARLLADPRMIVDETIDD